jgi:hypothetical protein
LPRKQKWREKNKDDLGDKIPEPPLPHKHKRKKQRNIKNKTKQGRPRNEYQLIMLPRKQKWREKTKTILTQKSPNLHCRRNIKKQDKARKT